MTANYVKSMAMTSMMIATKETVPLALEKNIRRPNLTKVLHIFVILQYNFHALYTIYHSVWINIIKNYTIHHSDVFLPHRCDLCINCVSITCKFAHCYYLHAFPRTKGQSDSKGRIRNWMSYTMTCNICLTNTYFKLTSTFEIRRHVYLLVCFITKSL